MLLDRFTTSWSKESKVFRLKLYFVLNKEEALRNPNEKVRARQRVNFDYVA